MKINGYKIQNISRRLIDKLINQDYTAKKEKDKYENDIIYIQFDDGESFTIE